MKLKSLFLLFLLSSLLLILICLVVCAPTLNEYRIERIRLSKIQKVCMKPDLRKRNEHIYIYSLQHAQAMMNGILKKSPLMFVEASDMFEHNTSVSTLPNPNYVTLAQVIGILNRLDSNIALGIATHTDTKGSKKENLQLSQARADRLKEYLSKRSGVMLITSIGYGEEFPLYETVKEHLQFQHVLLQIKEFSLLKA